MISGHKTEEPISSPTSIPFLKETFYPTFQANYIRSENLYTLPVKVKNMLFSPASNTAHWIKTKAIYLEYGVGIGYQNPVVQIPVGINVYRGSLQSETHKVAHPKVKIDIKYPRELTAFQSWRVGDSGRYQTYGGLSVSLSAGIGIVNLLNTAVVFQSQFWLEIEKVSSNKVQVVIREEKLNRKHIRVGPLVSQVELAKVKAHQFLYRFQLDLDDVIHRGLYQDALAGDLIEVQDKLGRQRQELSWNGSLKSLYVGIPKVIGVTYNRSEYQVKVDEEDILLAIDKKENMGFLLAPREHSDMATVEKDRLTLVWKSELKKLHRKAFKKNIFLKTEALQPNLLKEKDIPSDIGQFFGLMMVRVNWSQLTKLSKLSEKELLNDYKDKCDDQNLKCRKTKTAQKIITEFKNILKKTGSDQQLQLGKLFMRTPLFFRVIMENLKESYHFQFQLYMEKWQSMEGVSLVKA